MTTQQVWSPLYRGDEYAEAGDTLYLDTRDYAYYYNAQRKVIRRYGLDGSYCEIGVYKPSSSYPSCPLSVRLSQQFRIAKRNGRWQAYEPPHALAT